MGHNMPCLSLQIWRKEKLSLVLCTNVSVDTIAGVKMNSVKKKKFFKSIHISSIPPPPPIINWFCTYVLKQILDFSRNCVVCFILIHFAHLAILLDLQNESLKRKITLKYCDILNHLLHLSQTQSLKQKQQQQQKYTQNRENTKHTHNHAWQAWWKYTVLDI